MTKTFNQFITETIQKTKKPPAFKTVFGQHSLPYHERTVKEDMFAKYDGQFTHDAASHDSREGHDALAKHYEVGHPDKKHIRRYTADSTALNQSLIHKHEKPSDVWHAADHDREHGEHVKGLDAALSAHKTPSDIHVYSGTRFNPERFKPQGHDGKSHFDIHMPSYSSTSTSPHQANFYAGKDTHKDSKGLAHSEHKHMLHIEVPKGSPGAYIAHESHHQHEQEFLMHRGANLTVHPHPTIVPHGAGTVALWHAKLKQD